MRLDDEMEVLDMPGEMPGEDDGREADGAGSSAAQGEPERDTLSLVRDVVEEAVAEPAASPAEADKAGEQPGDQAPPEEDDYANLPFNRHPRFQKLIGEVKALRKEKADIGRAVEAMKPDAERYRNVQGFMDQNGLGAEEVAAHLTVLAQAKVDPVGAFERLKPAIVDLMKRAGVIMPDDLQAGVQQGTYTEQAAAELARLRAQQAARQHADSYAASRQTQSAEQQRVQGLQGAAVSWEQDRRSKDPNFQAKADQIARAVVWLQRRDGVPGDPEGVRKQLDAAYAEVNAAPPQAAAPQQRRLPVRPIVGGTNAGAARSPKPETTLDIIRARAGG